MKFNTYAHRDDPGGQRFRGKLGYKIPHWAVDVREEGQDDPVPPPVLLPCPFGCNVANLSREPDPPVLKESGYGSHWVECPECECRGPRSRSESDAIWMWNEARDAVSEM